MTSPADSDPTVPPPTGGDPLAAAIRSKLRNREPLDDLTFDAIYPERWRAFSASHWTPVQDAAAAVRWLTETGARRVLDVGAGVGKLCLYGALTTSGATFVGIEHRARRTSRYRGTREAPSRRLESIDPGQFDAFYLYNPFGENLADEPNEIIDRSVELGRDRYHRDVSIVQGWLRALPTGTRLVTLHGFGGWVPDSFRHVGSRRTGWDALQAWENAEGPKSRAARNTSTMPAGE
jgi:hypothetical protein